MALKRGQEKCFSSHVVNEKRCGECFGEQMALERAAEDFSTTSYVGRELTKEFFITTWQG
jgi:hypothetical protein